MEIPESGGTPSPTGTNRSGAFPAVLPDGRHLVFSVGPPGSPESGLYVGLINLKPGENPPKKLFPDASASSYFVPSGDPAFGYLLFLRAGATNTSGGTVMAATLDLHTWGVVGEPVPIAEGVSSFSASSTGVLVYGGGTPNVTGPTRGNIYGRLNWFDRQGKILGTFGDPGLYRTLAISPDGKRVAFERADFQNQINRNLWLYDIDRGVTSRFTFGAAWDAAPAWSPDGSQIAFTSNRSGSFDLYVKALEPCWRRATRFQVPGTQDRVVMVVRRPLSSLLFRHSAQPNLGAFARRPQAVPWWCAPISTKRSHGFRRTIAGSPTSPTNPERMKSTCVLSIPPAAPRHQVRTAVSGKWMVSKGGGNNPLWRRDGKELFYLSSDGFAMAVDVTTSGVFQEGIPKQMFKVPPGVLFWDVAPDGKRFVMPAPLISSADSSFTVVLNWQSSLKK